MKIMLSNRLWLLSQLVVAILLAASATVVKAECSGCLCPGNPCKLCPLPPTKDAPPGPRRTGHVRENKRESTARYRQTRSQTRIMQVWTSQSWSVSEMVGMWL